MAYKHTTTKGWAQIENLIREELRRWGADTFSLTRPNVDAATKPLSPANLVQTPEQALVRVVGNWKSGRKLELRYNKQARAVDNAAVLLLAIEGLRLNELRGIDDVMRQFYLQLPAPEGARVSRDPWEVLGLRKGASAAEINAIYRVKAQAAHADTGGSDTAMVELNEARERALREVGGEL